MLTDDQPRGYHATSVEPNTQSRQRQARRRVLCLLTAVALGLAVPGSVTAQSPDLAADLRIFESTTAHNSYPDDCAGRLDRLYIAEDLGLSIQVQFNRDLTDDEMQQVQWSLSNDDGVWSTGDFMGQTNPALVTTTVAPPARGSDPTQAMVHVMYEGVDIASPAPVRVVTNAEYDSALATLASFTAAGSRPRSQLPLTVDLLSRFLGQDSSAVGTPSLGTYQLDICDPRLTQRAGADWGADTVTDVPLVQYAADQPASQIVAEATARALLAQDEDTIRQFFVDNPQAPTYMAELTHTANLTLNRPPDAALSLHGVQFEGTLSASIDAPSRPDGPLVAHDVQVGGTVSDLYDFDLGAGGAGAFAAGEAAKVQIASVAHDIGKVFVVSFNLDSAFDSLDL
jgi:hypothetical protein